MPKTVNEWLTLIAAAWGALSVLIVWGFASGKFLQKRDDVVEDVRRRVAALAERVAANENRITEGDKARHSFIDRVNAELGRLRHKYELISQRMSIDEKHHDGRHAQIEIRLSRLEGQISDLQRQIDLLRGGQEFDGAERRRHPR